MSVRTSGYTFVAVRSEQSGVMHVAWSEHFGVGTGLPVEHAPPARTTLCRRVAGNDWTEVGAKAWYEPPPKTRKCLICGPRIGPYATVKL